MRFFDKIKAVISQPTAFFRVIKKEKGIGGAFLYYFIFLVIMTALSVFYYISSVSAMPLAGTFGGAMITGMIIGNFAISLVAIFIVTGIIHLFCRWLKGTGDYSDTFKAIIYGSTPSLIFSPIFMLILGIISMTAGGVQNMYTNPILFMTYIFLMIPTFAIAIWSIVLEIKGIKILHKISTWRAVLAVIILPIVLILIIIIIIVLIIIAMIGAFMAAIV